MTDPAPGNRDRFERLTREWFDESCRHRYSYGFTWLGRPVIQYPSDLLAMQEILWNVRPEVVIETGVAHGGSLVFYASILELIGGEGRVLGIDREIRPHNRTAIEAHPLSKRITLHEGSSTDDSTIRVARDAARGKQRVLVSLDSNHTHAHVLRELELYAPLVTKGSYLIVFDTVIEDMPVDAFPDRPWKRGDNPKTAVREFLRGTDRFEVDRELEQRIAVTVAPEGFLRCVK